MTVLGRLASLHLYPVKSARGLSVPAAELDAFGLADDRRFMVVDTADGRFVSQREVPQLALVQPTLAGAELRLEATGHAPLVLPRRPTGPRRHVTLWDWDADGDAVDTGDAAAAWWSAVLGRAVRFVWSPDDTRRATQPTPTGVGGRVAFSDGFPLLVVSDASLHDLNARLAQPVPMDRFRPNLVITDVAAPFAEDGWTRVRVGPVLLRGTKRCPRCTITTVDQATGERSDEPLRTLASYRRDDGKVWFGLNAEHEGEGRLAVGDLVEAA